MLKYEDLDLQRSQEIIETILENSAGCLKTVTDEKTELKDNSGVKDNKKYETMLKALTKKDYKTFFLYLDKIEEEVKAENKNEVINRGYFLAYHLLRQISCLVRLEDSFSICHSKMITIHDTDGQMLLRTKTGGRVIYNDVYNTENDLKLFEDFKEIIAKTANKVLEKTQYFGVEKIR